MRIIFAVAVICLAVAVRSDVVSTSTNLVLTDNINWMTGETALALGRYNYSDMTNKLFQTVDGGQTWTDITSSLLSGTTYPPYSPMYRNPSFPNYVYLVGSGTYSWMTANGGRNWTAIPSALLYYRLRWHPTNPGWALATARVQTTTGVPSVFFTQNAGVTWKKVRDNVIQYGWGDADTGDVPASRIYLITYTQGQNIPFNLAVTDDFGANEQIIEAHSYQFVFLAKQMFAMTYLPTLGNGVLKVTPDVGKKYKTFYEAKFPFGDTLENNGYALLDDTTGAVYIGVNHGDASSHWGNIYVSDAVGVNYVLSFEHSSAYLDGGVAYDFEVLGSVEGVYMANMLTNWEEDNTDRQFDEFTTYFTLDNGNTWQELNPPHFDSQGNKINCNGCNLHLSGYVHYLNNNYGPFYSAPNAVGLIIGTGNVGMELTKDNQEVNTFLSRDAGLTWIELRKGTSIYEIGDYGGVIVLAPTSAPTTTVYYTLDFGATVLSYTFTQTPVTVYNIITEPTATTRKFIILTEEGIMFGLDFSSLFPRSCSDKDFELWTPSNGRTALNQASCLLGHTDVYRRRNASALCYNDGSLNALVSSTNCACTEDDYECDFGYQRDAENNCVVGGSVDPPTYPPKYCPAGSTYYISKGYRMVAGDTCEGGVDHKPQGPVDCPTNYSVFTSNKGWIAAVIVVPLVVILLVLGFIAIRNEKLREKLPFLKALSSWKVGYFGMGKPDTVEDEEDQMQDTTHDFTVGIENDNHGPDHPDEEHEDLQAVPQSKPLNIQDDDFNPRL